MSLLDSQQTKQKEGTHLMPAIHQTITDKYALYQGDAFEIFPELPAESIHMSIYSPAFVGLYVYSSNPRDLSNCRSYAEFFTHYEFLVRELHRVTLPGRISAVHCMDVPGTGNGETAKMGCGANAGSGLIDFPGDIIRLHERCGFAYCGRRTIWKEPLGVRLRTMAKGLSHKQLTEDSTLCDIASADYLLMFRRSGVNKRPVIHPTGLHTYAGSRKIPKDLIQFKGHTGKQTENRFSHWIWRQYASSNWWDIRGCDGTGPKDEGIRERGTLPYEESKDADDEKHCHPLHLDVIERAVQLWSNPGEVVATPFMGVGSEVWAAVASGRFGLGVELKNSYYQQSIRNMALIGTTESAQDLF